MLVYKSANQHTGKNWYDGFAATLPSMDQRRNTAMQVAWPTEQAVLPNSGKPSYNALAVYWRDDAERLKQLASALFDLKALADQHAGQNIAVFTQGSPESLDGNEGMLVSPVTMLISVVAQRNEGATPKGALEYQFAGRRIASDSDKTRPVQSLRMSVGIGVNDGIQSLSMSEFGTSYVLPGEPAQGGASSLDILEGAVTFDDDPEEYGRLRTLTEVPLLIGNTAVHEFVSRLSVYDTGDARQNWRDLSPEPGRPLPNLAQIFPPVVLPEPEVAA